MTTTLTGGNALEFFAVPLTSLRLDTVTDFDMYLKSQSNQQPVLYRQKNLPFTEEARGRLTDNKVDNLWVRSDQESEYRKYVEAHLGDILNDDSVATEKKAEVLYTSAQGLVKDVFDEPRSMECIARSKELVKNTVQFMFKDSSAFSHLLKVTSFDYYTYTHSVNVFVFSVALAQRAYPDLGVSMEEFGEGALLHDIGKCRIGAEILNCKGKLSDEQWRIMKTHPGYGEEILGEHGTISDVALDIVRHHHEKLTGVGYPDSLEDEKISRCVRIVTIADIFDALTTKRSYKDALETFPALKIMKSEMSDQLDPYLFKVFVETLGNPEG